MIPVIWGDVGEGVGVVDFCRFNDFDDSWKGNGTMSPVIYREGVFVPGGICQDTLDLLVLEKNQRLAMPTQGDYGVSGPSEQDVLRISN